MTAYDVSEWSDFFVAAAGASAALAGLLFVAVSINLERIIAEAGLPDRALETVLLLLTVLVVSLLGLVPGQSEGALGIELLVFGIGVFFFVARLSLVGADRAGRQPRSWLISRWGIRVLALAPLIVGGASLITSDGGGLYWVAASIVFATFGGVANAWVLLVEILR